MANETLDVDNLYDMLHAMLTTKKATRSPGPTLVPRAPRPLQRLAPQRALVEQVLEQLRARILNGQYAADEELPPEGTLAETLGVSRTVIREAMRILRSQGLVEVSQGRRPRVKPPDTQVAIDSFGMLLQRTNGSVLDLIEIRRPVEGEMAFLAAQRVTPEQIERMSQAIADQEAAPDLGAGIEADLRFHSVLAEATGNPMFQVILAAFWGLLRHSLSQTIRRTGAERATQGHRRVMQAVQRRDGAAARAAMLEHLRWAEEDLRAAR